MSKSKLKCKICTIVINTTIYVFVVVIPSKAINLTLIEKTSSSALIQWSVGYPMQNFPPGVVQKVEYQSQWDSRDHWQVMCASHFS